MGRAGIAALIVIILLSPLFAARVVVYQNEGCGHCVPYVEGLSARLGAMGFAANDLEVKYILGDEATRKEFAMLQERFGVPPQMYGHLVVSIDNKYLFEGHVPVSMIEEFMKKDAQKFSSVVVTQDKMTDAPENYMLLKEGRILECDAKKSIAECYEAGGSAGGGAAGGASGFGGYDVAVYAGIAVVVLLVAYLFVKRGK